MNHTDLPLVSVIVPVYNALDTIVRAVDSALGQTDVTVEVLVIDDCSSDSTAELVTRHYTDEPRVRLLHTNSNSGPSVARNIGLEHARGDWVALLDADDWIDNNRLKLLIDSAMRHKLDFVADSYYFVTDQHKLTSNPKFTSLGAANQMIEMSGDQFIRWGLGSVKPVINRAFLSRTQLQFDPLVWRGEDFQFFISLFFHSARFGFLNTPMYYRSYIGESLSNADRLRLLQDVTTVLSRQLTVAKSLPADNQSFIDALVYRQAVLADSMAMVRLKSWLKSPAQSGLPGLNSLPAIARHLLFKTQRYPA